MAKPLNWPSTTPWPVTSVDEVKIDTIKPDNIFEEGRTLLFTFLEPINTTVACSPNCLLSLSFVLKDFEKVSWTIRKHSDRDRTSLKRIKQMFQKIDNRYLKYNADLSMVKLHTHLYFLRTEDLIQKLHTQILTDLHTNLNFSLWMHNHALLSIFSLLKYDTPIDIVRTITLNCFECIDFNYTSLFKVLCSKLSIPITNMRLVMETVHSVSFQSASDEIIVMAFFDYIKSSNPLAENSRAKLNYLLSHRESSG